MQFACSLCIGDVQKGSPLLIIRMSASQSPQIATNTSCWCFQYLQKRDYWLVEKYLHLVIHELAFVTWCLMSTPRKLWTQICVLLLDRASIKSATDRSSFDVVLLIPPQTKGCASYYAFIIPSSPFSFVQLSPSILLLIRSSLFASCHFAAQQHNPTSCKTLKLKINFIRAVRRCLSLHCFILCFTVYWRPLLAFSGLQCRKLPARQDLHLLMNVDCE